VPRGDVTLTYDEAMAICLLLAEAADAVTEDDQLRDTWAEEARLSERSRPLYGRAGFGSTDEPLLLQLD